MINPDDEYPEFSKDALRREKDRAYEERNRVVAGFARVMQAIGWKVGVRDTPEFDPEWRGCIYIETPRGQMSWHYHESHRHLFAAFPPYDRPWDGHTTEQKYARLELLCTFQMSASR